MAEEDDESDLATDNAAEDREKDFAALTTDVHAALKIQAKKLWVCSQDAVKLALRCEAKKKKRPEEEEEEEEALIQEHTKYGSTAAGLYDEAAKLNAQARTLYRQSSDTYYKANDAAAYDDWVRARAHWDYFYHRSLLQTLAQDTTKEDCSKKAQTLTAKCEAVRTSFVPALQANAKKVYQDGQKTLKKALAAEKAAQKSTAAGLYAKAAKLNSQARTLYLQSMTGNGPNFYHRS